MKKRILGVAFGAALVFGSFGLSTQNADAQVFLIGEGLEPGRGSTETVSETIECESGHKTMCSGDGNLCSKTIGWDCIPPNQ